MTRIYLIRHAEAEGNLYRIAQGQSNSILTDRGWRQVKALEKRFADIQIDAVYSSDLYRTCATASALYQPRNLPLHRTKALREICRSSVTAARNRLLGELLNPRAVNTIRKQTSDVIRATVTAPAHIKRHHRLQCIINPPKPND